MGKFSAIVGGGDQGGGIVLPPVEPLPVQEDPNAKREADERRRKERLASLKRRGRAASVLTGQSGAIKDPLGGAGAAVARPQATNFGG